MQKMQAGPYRRNQSAENEEDKSRALKSPCLMSRGIKFRRFRFGLSFLALRPAGPIAERSKWSDLDCGRGPGFKSWRG